MIVEGKIKPETYTADGVEHKTFSFKADYIRKINFSAPSEASESKAIKARQEGQVPFAQPGGGSSEPPFLCPLNDPPLPGQRHRNPQLPST